MAARCGARKEAIRRSHSAAGDAANSPNSNCTCAKVVGLVRPFGALAARRTRCPGGAALIPAMLPFFGIKVLKERKKICVYVSLILLLLSYRELSFS
jgi:hypothetical protein